MRYLPIYNVDPGMILGKDLYDFNDKILLRQGKKLTETLIKRLREYGYQGVYVDDELSKDIYIDDIISAEMRSKAFDSIRQFDIDSARDVAKEIVERILNAETISLDMVDLRTFDNYTYYHSVNVAVLATIVGMGMGYNADELRDLCICGMFHDMGKLSIPVDILNKPAKLTREEYNIIKEHPRKSYDFIEDKWSVMSNVRMGVLCHHENEDGTGYPLGIKGEKIHPFAKILHVVDVYDALTSRRSYKKAYACSEALEYLMGGSGSMFDSKVVNVFMQYVPIYPKGMQVVLSNGKEGIIVENNPISSLRPIIRLLNGKTIDLMDMRHYSTITIIKQEGGDTATADEIEHIEHDRKVAINA